MEALRHDEDNIRIFEWSVQNLTKQQSYYTEDWKNNPGDKYNVPRCQITVVSRQLFLQISSFKIIDCQLSLMDCERNMIVQSNVYKQLWKYHNDYKYYISDPLNISYVQSDFKTLMNLPKDQLIFMLKVPYRDFPCPLCDEISHAAKYFSELRQNLKTLPQAIMSQSVDLRAGGVTVAINTGILISRSATLANLLLETKCREEFVDLPDVSVDEVNKIVEFLYTGLLVDVKPEQLRDFYIIAKNYKISSLLEIVRCQLMRTLTMENCFNHLEFAALQGDENMKVAVVEFIKPRLGEIVDKNIFEDMMRKDLITIMMLTEPFVSISSEKK